jgi:hypothetical protein
MKKWTIVSSLYPVFHPHGNDTQIVAGVITSVAGVAWKDIPDHVKYFDSIVVKGHVGPDQFEWQSVPQHRPRKLKAKWTVELAQDIESFWDPQALKKLEKMMAKDLSEQIAKKIDESIMKSIKP